MSENQKRDSKSPEISASKNEASSSKSGIHSHYPWIPVNSDEERLPRVRKVSESSISLSSISSSSSLTSEQESSSSNNLTKKIENELKKRGRSRNRIQNQSPNVKGWDKEPLSILWCLNSFDNKTKEDENLAQSRVILYDSNAKTVMAVEKLPSESGIFLK